MKMADGDHEGWIQRNLDHHGLIRSKIQLRRLRKWAEVAGPAIAARTSVVSFKRKVLRVRVDSSALLASGTCVVAGVVTWTKSGRSRRSISS